MCYMLDTNICIYIMRNQPPKVAGRLNELYYGDAVISAVTLAELTAGVEMQLATRPQNAKALMALLEDLPVLPFDRLAAASYGRLRAAVPDRRRDALDRLIAAHAIAVGTTLVTNNETDFAGYPGLTVENWATSA